MERVAYLIRRLLLVIPTFIGITIVCFALTRFLPGGPVEMRLMRMKGLGSAVAESGGGAMQGRSQVTEEYRKQLEAQFGFDKPILRQFFPLQFMVCSPHRPHGVITSAIKFQISYIDHERIMICMRPLR